NDNGRTVRLRDTDARRLERVWVGANINSIRPIPVIYDWAARCAARLRLDGESATLPRAKQVARPVARCEREVHAVSAVRSRRQWRRADRRLAGIDSDFHMHGPR